MEVLNRVQHCANHLGIQTTNMHGDNCWPYTLWRTPTQPYSNMNDNIIICCQQLRVFPFCNFAQGAWDSFIV